jgi:hypothetical protein
VDASGSRAAFARAVCQPPHPNRAFLIGAVLIRLTEHLRLRQRHQSDGSQGLPDLAVLEEAHRLLRDPGPGTELSGHIDAETLRSASEAIGRPQAQMFVPEPPGVTQGLHNPYGPHQPCISRQVDMQALQPRGPVRRDHQQ